MHTDELEAENERLREALAFYADASNYSDDSGCGDPGCCSSYSSSVEQDEGVIARAALGIPEFKPLPSLTHPELPQVTRPSIDPAIVERLRRFQEACDALA